MGMIKRRKEITVNSNKELEKKKMPFIFQLLDFLAALFLLWFLFGGWRHILL